MMPTNEMTVVHKYWQMGKVAKYLPFPGLLLTTAIVSALLQAVYTERTYSNGLYHFVLRARATVSIVVQIMSVALGAIHISVVTTLINFSTRLSITRRPTTLDRLKLWNPICAPRMDWSLPGRYILVL